MTLTSCETTVTPPHPRVLGWFGTSALAMGGSNQMIFLITALFVGQGAILGQGSAAVPLLIFGVLLGWARRLPGPSSSLLAQSRGGISAACAEASSVGGPGHFVDVISRAAEGRCRRLSWKPLQRRDRADRERLARGGGISRGARSHRGAGGLSSHLAARCCRVRTGRSHIGPLPARRRQTAGLQRERPLRLSIWRRGKDAPSIDAGTKENDPPRPLGPLIGQA